MKPKHGLPCDPHGGVLIMARASDFLTQAEANPGHYGQHGLAVFMAAHNDNCVVSPTDGRNTCMATWPEYNDLLNDLPRHSHGLTGA